MKRIAVAAAIGWGLALACRAEIKEVAVDYNDGDVALSGFFTCDDASAAPRPGVVIFHQWSGPSEHERLVAMELAKLGYSAFVADVFGKDVRPESTDERMKQVTKYRSDRALMRGRANAALKALAGQSGVDAKRLVAIGYCFGGTVALELARSGADLVGVVCFHGGLSTPNPADAKNIKGKVLVLHGADDPYESAEELAGFETEMRNAGVDWQLFKFSGAVHAFTQKDAGTDNSKGAAYNEKATRRAWQAFKDFLSEVFAKP